ncbi:hypothetical protein Forpi1262_v009537 [Fusarium oxysporum f. sp. raphani]|uniref:HAT C-terminal dimerisation domain-containing protein n=1 Tax=Fusarium oxysporum f. sp. raphani TaxID=96318 RepID=A0A8J5PLP9_FUSOX|nr:hypothetical protein Forpi1262_v009537 [Fusarium oxysporum f. sp. raphani]
MDYIIHQPTSLVEWIVDPLSGSTRGFSGVDCNPALCHSLPIEGIAKKMAPTQANAAFVWRQFIDLGRSNSKKSKRYRCRHCQKDFAATSVGRPKEHLAACEKWQAKQRQERQAQDNAGYLPSYSEAIQKKITEVGIQHISQDESHSYAYDAAAAVIAGGRPFSLFESRRWRYFFTRIKPGWKPPSRAAITRILPDFYQELYDVDEINRATTLKLRSKKPLKLIIDNDTRWLSQLYMIRRALRLKTSIELLLIKYKAQWEDENRSKKTGQVTQAKLAKKPRILRDENQLTDKDWEVLYHLEAILTVFETVVKTLEGDGHIRRRKQGWTGSYGNIWDVVLGYELLLNTLEEYKQLAADFPDPEHFRIGINLAWDKLDEYYRRLDETPIYYTAMALHPAYRWDWFDETWAHKPSWVEKAKEMVADVWLSDYAHLEVRTSSSRGDDEPPAKRPRFFNPFEKNSRLPSSIPPYAAAIVVDEYQAWQTDREASDGNVRDPIGYWITKQGRYPRLSRMALDFLTIQPMSAECERLFSAAGKMVSGLRTNLDAEIIAICQVLRSWYRAGLIKDLDPLLKSHLESKLDGGYGTLSDDELALAESKWLLEGEDSASEVNDSTQQQQAEESVSTSESEAE